MRMGVLLELLTMDTNAGYCRSSAGKRMNQHMIEDHMLSHYKKLYSAKAAVDCSMPKSMCCNVKYVDQKRREQQKRDTLSQSGRSSSQRSTRVNSRTSCSSKNSRTSVQGHKPAHQYLDQSMMSSSPRISTSFHNKQIVYPSHSHSPASHFCSASELQTYRSPDPRWHQTGHVSCATSASQRRYKSFQDPSQKTYSGDVLSKHSHRFTQEKLFTPRTLKSDHKSKLLQYRYYTPPRRRDEDEKPSSSRILRQETYHGSTTKSKRSFSPQLQSPQMFSVDQDWSDEESDSFRHHRKTDFPLSSSRVSPEGMRSPIMRKVSAEEEELLYLEFITDVTNEILAQGLYSDRVLKRVFERHVDMNRHRLDENKMRHLLDKLQDDIQSSSDASVSFLGIEEPDGLLQLQKKFLHLGQELPSVPKDDTDYLPHTASDYFKGHRENITPPSSSTPVNSSLLQRSSQTDLQEVEIEPLNSEFNHNAACEISLNDDDEDLTCTDEKRRNAEDDNELKEQIHHLEKTMTELLKVSERRTSEDEQTTDRLSDDEF